MTTPAEALRYAEDTVDEQAVTIAALLEENAELRTRADQTDAFGRWLRRERATALDKHRTGVDADLRQMTRAIAFGDAISRYEQMEGSS